MTSRYTERCPRCGIQRLGVYRFCPKCGHMYEERQTRTNKPATYDRCMDCKWLSGERSSIGIRCMNPAKTWEHDYTAFKRPSAKACRKIERKEEKGNK